MARSVASLGVSVTARTSGFRKGMKRGQKTLQSFRGSIIKTVKRLAGFGAALTAVAAGGGLAIMVKRSMASIDAMAKLADRIGTTTEKLAGLQHAAEITGAGSELMAKSLDVMAKRLGEAAGGTGEAKSALQDLGLNVNRLMAMDPAEAFREIAEKISNLATQSEKAAAASKIFSRAGLQLVNTLELGRAGLDAMQAEAEALGLTFSRIDAAKIEAANDAIVRMRASFQGLATMFTAVVAPALESMADTTTDFIKDLQVSNEEMLALFRNSAIAVGHLADAFGLILGSVLALQVSLASFIALALKAAGAIAGVFKLPGLDFSKGGLFPEIDFDAPGFSDDLKRFGQAFGDVAKENGKLMEDLLAGAFTGKAAESMRVFFSDMEVEAKERQKKNKQRRDRATPGDVEALVGGASIARRAADTLRKGLRTGFEILKDDIFEFDQLMQTGAVSIETASRKQAEFNKRMLDVSGITAMAKSAKAATAELKQRAKDLALSLRTPMQVLRDFFDETRELFRAGFIDQATFDRAIGEFQKRQQGTMPAFAGGTELGRFQRIGTAAIKEQPVTDKVVAAKLDKLNTTVDNLSFDRVP